jgi:hypothetical protein
VIVRRDGDGWTLIRQIDHAAHCGKLSQAWRSGPNGPDSISEALEQAASRHDLGWTEIDLQPEIDHEGKPMNFTQIDEVRHTQFYSGAVRTIAATDPSAAYLVSLHASGLYSRRYAWAGLKPVDWTAIGPHGKNLLDGERRFRAELATRLQPEVVEFEIAWRSYMLLETLDYLSLLTCFGFESAGCSPVPTISGQWEQLAVRRLGPFEVELRPFPFPGDRLELDVECRHVGQERFADHAELRSAVAAARLETRRTVYSAA